MHCNCICYLYVLMFLIKPYQHQENTRINIKQCIYLLSKNIQPNSGNNISIWAMIIINKSHVGEVEWDRGIEVHSTWLTNIYTLCLHFSSSLKM